ncbi:MAG: hypothetical protein MJA82_15125 [Clostridia bacterium]|nr:hypothetical protein [Clostridia bacterium]
MTIIEITPPGGEAKRIKAFVKCLAVMSSTDKSGSFSISIPISNQDIDILNKFVIGSDVRIMQGKSVFRGWILNAAKAINGPLKNIEISGMSYTARTQKILVTENYINQEISFIVKDLFSKYAPQYNQDSITECSKIISVKFNDIFLFDAMETLSNLAGYDWYIDEPMPEEINPQIESSGWVERVQTLIHKVNYPLEDLYPLETLYPA